MSKEIIFTGNYIPAKKLHYQVNGDNRVFWQEVPVGEQGTSIPFRTLEEAEGFMNRYARILGYLKREAD